MTRRGTLMLASISLLGMTIVVPQPVFAQSDPWLGTWQLNLAKSKYSPGPPPKSQTAKIEAEGQNHKVTVTGTDAAGKPTSAVFTRIYGGMPNPTTAADFDAAALTRVDSNTIIIGRTKAGKLVQTVTNVMSQDGRTNTITTIGTDAAGRPFNSITVWDKQ